MLSITTILLFSLFTPFVFANPIEVRDPSPSWPERFALLDRDGCYKLKRELGIENVGA